MSEFYAILPFVSEWMGVSAVMLLSRLSASFRFRPVGFRFPRREGVVSLSLFVLIMVAAVAFFSTVTRVTAPIDQLWQRLALAMIALLAFGLALIGRGQPLRSVGWGKDTFKVALRLGLALAFLTLFLRGKIFTIINGLEQVHIYALLAWIGIALAEETVFRGYLQLRLFSWLGERRGWVVSVLLFVVWQIPRLWVVNPTNLWLGLLMALVNGILLTWISRNSGHVVTSVLYRIISEWSTFLG